MATKLPKFWGGNQCNNFGNGLEGKKFVVIDLWLWNCRKWWRNFIVILAIKLPKMRVNFFYGNGIAEMEGKKNVAIDLWQCCCRNEREKNVAMKLLKIGGEREREREREVSG